MRVVTDELTVVYRVGIFLAALLIGLLMFWFSTLIWDSPAELGAYDMLLRMRPSAPLRGDIAIIGIDADTLVKLGPLPWSNGEHARIIRALQREGARFVAYDMLFSTPDTTHRGADAALFGALSSGGNVFLPMVYDPLRSPDWTPADIRGLVDLERYALAERIIYPPATPLYRYYYFIPPWADFVGAADGVGVAVGGSANPAVMRKAQLAYLTNVEYPVPSQPLPTKMPMPKLMNRTVVLQGLPLIVSRAALGNPPVQTDFTGSISFLTSDLTPSAQIPIDSNGCMLINYAGPAGTYPTYSTLDLLNRNLPQNVLAGKTVFAGVTDPSSPYPTMLPTPYGDMPRVEVTANAVGTILDGTYIVRTRNQVLVTLLVLAIILGLLLPVISLRMLGFWALMLSLIYILIALLVVMVFHYVLPVIPALLLIILTAVAAGLFKPAMYVPGEPASYDPEQV